MMCFAVMKRRIPVFDVVEATFNITRFTLNESSQ